MTAMMARRSATPVGEWHAEAACRSGVDPELFFPAAASGPTYAVQVAAARAVCGRCPVRARCLDWALDQLPYGIAGGLTEQERTRLRAGGRKPSAHDALAQVVESRRALAAAGRAALAAGKSPQRVAREFGVTQRTAQRWAQQLHAATSNTGSAGRGEEPAATGLPTGTQQHTTPWQGHEQRKEIDG
jgi:hypothetical protein